jgi:hypothetical protein
MKASIAWILVWLLASRAGTAAAFVLARTRYVWHRWMLAPMLPTLRPAGLKTLGDNMRNAPDPARLMYSMALAHLDSDSPHGAANALACLRAAEALGFEGRERILLYRAIIAARRGGEMDAHNVQRQLDTDDLSAAEWGLLDAATRPSHDGPRTVTV